ncbi:hypothetical protein [Rhodobacter lacus]|uniref:Uncharacterized protein n=1 Tax=Rhodobacter lacus TaxID=1641972 RepID=A0ABW5ACD9_9RHOB
MGRILQAVIVLVILAVLGVLGYAYFGDMQADPVAQRAPVTLPGLAPPAPATETPPAVPAAPVVPESAPVFGGSSAPAEAPGGN